MHEINNTSSTIEAEEAETRYFYSESGNIVLCLISFLCFLMNICEIIYIKRKKSKNSYETLLLSLSISDALFGFANATLPLLYLTQQISYTYIVRYAYLCSLLLSTVHLTTLAIDRCVAISFPLKHRIYWKIKHAKFFLLILWLLSIVTTYLLYPYKKAYDFNDTKFVFQMKNTISSTLTTAEILLVVLYTLVYMQIIKQNRRMSKINNGSQQVSVNRQKNAQSSFILCLLTALTFIFCTLSFNIQMRQKSRAWPNIYATTLLVINSGLNSFIYYFYGRITRWKNERLRRRKGTITASSSQRGQYSLRSIKR